MEHIAPLIQTVLWVGLIAFVLWRFYSPIYGILVALQKRIESGSSLKAGPFEIAEQLKPQEPSKQEEKLAIELQETQQASSPETTPHTPPSTTLRAKYFQVEDLALRAIQSEYGTAVSRQVTGGSDIGFDGAFVTNGRLNLVEIKYVVNPANIKRFKNTIDKLTGAIDRYGWRNAQIILMVIFENEEDVTRGSKQLQTLFRDSSVPVVVRCYSFSELQVQFGVNA